MFLALILAGGVQVTLLPQATVRGTEIVLSQVATIEGDDAAEVERVRAIKLGYAPAPGYARTLVAPRVSADVARLVPGITIDVKGALSCRVTPQVERVGAAAIEASARAEIARALSGAEHELALNTNLADLEVPAGNGPVDLRAVAGDTALRAGPINVAVRVSVDGQLYRTVWTNWRLSVWEDANVLRRDVAAGETITLDLLERKRVLGGAGAGEVTLAAGLALGSTARRPLAAGHVLRESDVLRSVIVKRGDTLFLEVRRGNVHARMPAVAEQDAHPGERIKVTLTDSKRTLAATVVSRELALIDLQQNG
ncbi:MAG: flagellar basal body P-ring formation protein FlgA [Planctomycetes bacterium]|nr:flagellar basal body P-ring formation protein FlgA [Planctomycetota bacterium]